MMDNFSKMQFCLGEKCITRWQFFQGSTFFHKTKYSLAFAPRGTLGSKRLLQAGVQHTESARDGTTWLCFQVVKALLSTKIQVNLYSAAPH